MADLFIYYRVPDGHAAQLAPRVQAMQASLAASLGIAGQLEIYTATGPGFDAALAAAVQDAALSELIAGKRHTEVFTDISTCV